MQSQISLAYLKEHLENSFCPKKNNNNLMKIY